jgi:hypothetical protein
LPLLNRRYKGYEKNLMEWLESLLIELAGKMRLQAAVPILVERMLEDDLGLNDSSSTALSWMGGDVVAGALADHWHGNSGDFRTGAAEIMGHIHTDLSVQKLLEFFSQEEDEETKDFLASSLLANFLSEAVEPIRQIVLPSDLSPDQMDLKYHLIAACTIMGVTFPEYEQWYEAAVEDNFGWHDYKPDRIRKHFQEKEDEDEPEWRNQRKVGRNDPCPCGSGKKFKKCCMKKE